MRVKLIQTLIVAAAASGCASSRVTAFRDLSYQDTRFHKIAAFAVGMTLPVAVEVERQICARVAPVECIPGKTILPPTRSYSNEEIADQIDESKVGAVLIVALVADEMDSQYVGTWTNSSANASSTSAGQLNLYGTGGFWSGSSVASASATAVSTPLYSHSRHARALLGLFESQTGNVVWSGEINTTGGDVFSTSTDEFVRATSAAIAGDLKRQRLVGPSNRTETVTRSNLPDESNSRSGSLLQVVVARALTPAHETPSPRSKIIYRLKDGTVLPVVEDRDGWYRVVIRGQELYIDKANARAAKE